MPALAALRTAARAHVQSTLAIWGLGDLVDTAETIVSELVANAVNASADAQGRPLYLDGKILKVWIRLDAYGTALRAEVWDQAPGVPELQEADEKAESGRGLALVRDFSDTWGWYPARGQPGKYVWARISTESQAIPGSLTEGAPVTHDHHKPIGLDSPERRNDRTTGHPVLSGQLRHRRQPLL